MQCYLIHYLSYWLALSLTGRVASFSELAILLPVHRMECGLMVLSHEKITWHHFAHVHTMFLVRPLYLPHITILAGSGVHAYITLTYQILWHTLKLTFCVFWNNILDFSLWSLCNMWVVQTFCFSFSQTWNSHTFSSTEGNSHSPILIIY